MEQTKLNFRYNEPFLYLTKILTCSGVYRAQIAFASHISHHPFYLFSSCKKEVSTITKNQKQKPTASQNREVRKMRCICNGNYQKTNGKTNEKCFFSFWDIVTLELTLHRFAVSMFLHQNAGPQLHCSVPSSFFTVSGHAPTFCYVYTDRTQSFRSQYSH